MMGQDLKSSVIDCGCYTEGDGCGFLDLLLFSSLIGETEDQTSSCDSIH